MLDNAQLLNEDRGLTTVVGEWQGNDLIVSAFGMGAPIAALVLHELAAIGATTFVRAGTAMSRRPPLGSFVVADRAFIHEGTSVTYGFDGPVIDLDTALADRLVEACGDAPTWRGTVATCDGFYTQMTDLLGPVPPGFAQEWDAADVIGLDMETSALASAAAALGVRFGSLCLATVDANGPVMMDPDARTEGERRLMRAAFDALSERNPL